MAFGLASRGCEGIFLYASLARLFRELCDKLGCPCKHSGRVLNFIVSLSFLVIKCSLPNREDGALFYAAFGSSI